MSVFLKVALLIISIKGICPLTPGIGKAFEDFKIVPDVIDKAPQQRVNVSYGDQKIYLGTYVHETALKQQPSVAFPGETGKFYTLILVNPDNPTPMNPEARNLRMWLVVNIPGPSDLNSGKVITSYIDKGFSPYYFAYFRRVLLIFEQPNGEIDVNPMEKKRNNFNVRTFAQEYNLSTPVFGNFFISRSANNDLY